MKETQLTAREPLCDLQMVKAEYGAFGGKDGTSGQCFRIKLVSSKQDVAFDVREEEGGSRRSWKPLRPLSDRVIRARMIGEERS